MTVALIAVVALLMQGLTVAAFIRYTRARAREDARERRESSLRERDLVDRVMHMADHTWTPPPQPDYGDKDDTVAQAVIYPEQTLPTIPAGY